MSEEEIIQGINRTIAFMKEELKAEHSCFSIQELWALNGIVELYNKQKEKNKLTANDIECYKKEAYMLGKADEYKSMVGVIERHYISKDKIKEFIKQEAKPETYNFKTISVEKLQELLEE